MFTLISLVIETITTVVCIYRIHGKKVKFDFKTAALIILMIVILITVNHLGISEISTVLNFILIFIYCKSEFRESLVMSGAMLFLLNVIMTALQFICLLLTSVIVPDNIELRNFIVSLEVLCFCIFLLPGDKLDRLRKNIFVRNRYVVSVCSFVEIVIIFLLLQGKLFGQIQVEMFIFAIPAVLMIVVLVGKWNRSQERIVQIEKELDNNIRLQERYRELLQKVRLRQHEFKNHLAAIFSFHYTHKTYDKLVEAQREYCHKLAWENRYNGLALIGNDVLAGFLYGKFEEVEARGLCVEYAIHTKLERLEVPNYYLIEILGVLIDNAVEAYDSIKQQKVFFSMEADEENYYFKIRNQFAYVPYAEIEQWFQPGGSSKGEGRGLGLHHVKILCDEWGLGIRCENLEEGQENWIQFTLIIKSAGSQE